MDLFSGIVVIGMPLAAACGWCVRHFQAGSGRSAASNLIQCSTEQSAEFTASALRSCSILEQLSAQNPDNFDLRLALAAMYREQGDYIRSIEMHEAILNNKQLDRARYAEVSLELARDYFAAGLFDRAESRLHSLLNRQVQVNPALHLLMNIYEQLKNWRKAIVVAKRLKYQGENTQVCIAQYYCEQAELATAKANLKDSMGAFAHAVLVDPWCARAHMGMAEHYHRQENYLKAISHFSVILDRHPPLIPLIVEPLYNCYEAIDRADDCVALLRSRESRCSLVSVILIVVAHVQKAEGGEAALSLVMNHLREISSLRLLRLAIVLIIRRSTGQWRSDLRVWEEMLDRKLVTIKPYRCNECGQCYDKMTWRCAACSVWAQVFPIREASSFASEAEAARVPTKILE